MIYNYRKNKCRRVKNEAIYTWNKPRRGRKNRSCSVNLLEVNESYYLFDCGGDVESKIKNLGKQPGEIKAIFISHMHIDHIAGLPALSKHYYLHYNKSNNKAVVFFPEENAADSFLNWLNAAHFRYPNHDAFDLKVNRGGEIFRDKNITVTAIPTKHIQDGNFPSFAFVIEGEGKRMLYTGDLSPTFEDYPEIVFEKDFDLILSELVHFDIEKNLPIISKSRTKKLIFTHVSLKKIPIILENRNMIPFPLEIAEDGLSFEI